jgi:thiol:disulfide interchange protein DsbD
LAGLALPAWSQVSSPQVVAVQTLPGLKAHRGADLQVPVRLVIRGGYHINSNEPAEDYLIPTALTWPDSAFPLRGISYPKPESVKYEFSAQPLLVYSGIVTVTARFQVPASAAAGATQLAGKLRYQACTSNACLPPRTVNFFVPVTVE